MASKASQQRLLVFAKAPVAGEVKTRLQPLLSEEQSALFHERLVRHCLHELSGCDEWEIELWVGSPHSCWEPLVAAYGCELFFQQGMDLGARLSYTLDDASSRAEKVIVIGTDCPTLTPKIISRAFAALDQYDVVLGPAEDGGYVLLGLSHCYVELFLNIDWGTENVLAQTRSQIERLSLSCFELPTLFDIDRPEDFFRLQHLAPELTTSIDVS